MNTISKIALVAVGALTMGCASTAVEDQFGDSVRHTMAAQIVNKDAAENPPAGALDGIDGNRVQSILRVYREDVSKPEKVSDDIVVNIGN